MDNKLKKNIIYNALYQALVILLPILTMPYLVRTLSKEQIGINSYSLSVVQIFIVISFWGINNYASREIASQKESSSPSGCPPPTDLCDNWKAACKYL